MGMTRDELFNRAKAARAEAKNQSSNKGNGGTYEEVVYTSLEVDLGKVVRLLGAPIGGKRLSPFDPKVVNLSMVKGDNGSKFRCIWPLKEEQPDWILWRIYDLVMAYKWDPVNNRRNYLHSETHNKLFKRVSKNDSDNALETGFTPSKTVLWNVIDRHDMQWHKENKHTKALSKKSSMGKDGTVWYDAGVPLYLYDIIFDELVEYYSDWELYDVILFKMKNQPFYKALHGTFAEPAKVPANLRSLVVEGVLTEEERSWERYDFDKLFPVTSYSKIKNRLALFVKQVDGEFGTSFYDELEELVKKEALERKDVEETTPPSSPEPTPVNPVGKVVEPPVEVRQRTVRTPEPEPVAEIDWKGLADGSYNGKVYLGVPDMTNEEKAMVESVNEDGSFVYKAVNGKKPKVLLNTGSQFRSPDSFHIDPLSGDLF